MKQIKTSTYAYDDDVSSDAEVHTVQHPYCNDSSCWCHTSVSYHEDVTQPLQTPVVEQEVATAWSFFGFGRR